MKRLLILAAVCVFTMSASAQISNLFKSITGMFSSSSSATTATTQVTETSSTANTVLNVLGNLIGSSLPVSESSLVGAWNYDGVSCVLESDQALANLGGNVVTASIEEKLDTYLAKVGVAPGACTFTFLDNDSCKFTVMNRSLNGTYKMNTEDKTVALSFYGYLNMTAHVSYGVQNVNLVFEADRLLELIKKVASMVASGSDSSAADLLTNSNGATTLATLKTMSALLDNYTGMMLGMKLKK